MVVRAAHAANRPVSVCGEAAADPLALPLLIGLGVDAVSVAAGALPEVRRLVRALLYRQLQSLAAEACARATPQEVLAMVRRTVST
jgi:phosphocarrier protein FPr